MSANANQEILDRLSSLERANDNLVRDGLQRQREYGDLQRDIFQCHRDNSHLKEMMQSRLVDLERKMEEIELLKNKNGQLERDLAQVAEARDNIHHRLTQLEDQTHVKESNDRFNDMQSAVNSLRQDMTNVNSCHRTLSETVDTWALRQKSTKGMFDDRLQIQKAESEELHQSLSTSLDTTQRQVDGRLQRLEAGSLEIHQTVANSLETTQRQVDDSIKHSEEKVEHRLTSVMADTTLLGKQVIKINNMNNTFKQSVTSASLLSTRGLVGGEWVKVDMCLWLEGSPGMVDKATGCLVPKRKGRYVVGLRMAQKGDGGIMVHLKWDGTDVGYTMVLTVRDGDVKSGLVVMEMEEGGKYWLEAMRVKGTAEILWCNVYCWFLSPC